MKLSGKASLVTGAARGIGRAIAERLADEGSNVALADVRKELLTDVAAAVDKKGVQSLMIAADVTQPTEVASMINAVISNFGGRLTTNLLPC